MPEFLFETPDNPSPANAIAGMLAMRDGKRMRYARFSAEGRPLQGTVVIIPGRNEFIEKYFETVTDLSARGFGAVVCDLRGQGGSDRLLRNPDRGYIADFQHYADDIDTLFEQVVLPDCRGPYFVLGHSTGALVALLAAPHLANRVERMVLASPLLGLPHKRLSMRNTRRLAGLLRASGFGRIYLDGGPPRGEPLPFAGNRLTSDPRRYRRNASIAARFPDLAIGGPTATWVWAACKAIEKVTAPEFVAGLQIPVLFVVAGDDRVVDSRATQHYARRLRGAALLTVDGARHELLQEADIYREQMLAAFDAFVPGGG